MADDEEVKPAAPEIPVQESHVVPIKVAQEATEVDEDADDTAAATVAPAVAEEPRKVEKLPDWAQKTIKDTAFEAREAKRRAAAAEARVAQLEANPPKPIAVDEAAAREAAPNGGFSSQAEFDAAVQTEANKREMNNRAQSQAREFGTQLDGVWNKGVEIFKDDFGTVAENLNAVGVLPVPNQDGSFTNTEFMRLVMATDHPAEVLHAYGSDPEKARALMLLSPEKRAIEIGKADAGVARRAPDPISKAPRPVETVEGTARVSEDPRDDDSDAMWFAKREKQLAARR